MVLTTILLLAATAQTKPDTAAYLDRDAQVLVERSRAARYQLGREIGAYTATVKQRMGVALRMPLKDRTLYRSETAAKVRWSRDEESVVKLLGARQQHPGAEYSGYHVSRNSFDELYDPTNDRLYFGLTQADDEEVWIDHPLIEGSEANYRFQTGDTLTMRFAGSPPVTVVELRVLPRVAKPKLITGSLWIEPKSGAVVKAAFRMSSRIDLMRDTDVFEGDDEEDLKHVPPFLKPFEVEVNLITVEYAYWNLKHWLPRSMRFEGIARAGILTAPATGEMSYEIHEVFDDSTAAAENARAVMRQWRAEGDNIVRTSRHDGKRVYQIQPTDDEELLKSKDLPPPVWEHSDDFISTKELAKLYGGLADLPTTPNAGPELRVTWPPRALDLMRYNRVEGLSLGVRGSAAFTHTDVQGTLRLGAADLQPNASLLIQHSSLRRTLSASVSHGLQAVDARSLAVGSSAAALLLGRDDGEYYRASSLRATLEPPDTRARTYALTLFAERHRSVEQQTEWSFARVLDSDFAFRPNLRADAADLAGAELMLRRWWGTDPMRWQTGAELVGEAATGDFQYGRAMLTLRTAFQLGERTRAALELGGGSATNDLPIQKQFFLGGAHTLRGYHGSSLVGPTFTRARAELARTFVSNGASFALFSDAGWAGARREFSPSRAINDALVSAGVGMSILDGLVRLDLARALRQPTGWRFELHLDAIL